MKASQSAAQAPSWIRRSKRAALALSLVGALLAAAFCWNGLSSEWERPDCETTSAPPRPLSTGELRVLAYNLAKVELVASKPIRSQQQVRQHLDQIAALIREADPDLVLLSEVVAECTPCPVDQVRYLAEATGMHAWAFGEQYNFGLPVFRIRGGNAVLSRLPLRPMANQQLVGGASFVWPANNRRALWCEVKVRDSWLRVASIHTDSFDRDNNARQARQLLRFVGEAPALVGGDFNAQPESESLRLFEQSGLFTPLVSGPPTFPAGEPTRRIDHVLGPRVWSLDTHEVISTTLSDHRPVLSVFRLPPDVPAERPAKSD